MEELFSNTSQVIVLPIVVPGNIIEDQFLCYNSIADPIYMDTLSYGGDNNFSYQWEFSTDSINWNEVFGADTTVYDPGLMNQSTFYRLKVSSTYSSNCIDRYSNIIDIHVYDPLASGVINANQDICFSTQPDPLSFSTPPSGADGNYTYTWQESSNLISIYNDIPNSDTTIYQPPILDSTRYYKVLVVSDFGCGSLLSYNTLTINVNDQFNEGSILNNDTICYLQDPDLLFFDINPSGGNFNNSSLYDYQWQVYDNGNWNNILNASDSTYQPLNLDDSISYRLNVSSDCMSDYTNEVFIIVNPLPDTTLITGQMLVCENQLDVSYSILNPNSVYRYQWVSSDGQFVGTNESQNLLINWTTSVETTQLGVYVRVYETGCEIYLDTTIAISENIAPQNTQIVQKPNTNILICDDSTSNINYQWGSTNISSGIETIFIEDTLRYNQFNNIDTIIYRYWVDTYFNYSNNFSCITRSYFNPPPIPLDVDNYNVNLNFVYPNPFSDKVYLIGRYKNIKVFDLYGKLLIFETDHKDFIDMSSYEKGIYFISAELNGKIITNKIILQ